MKSFFTLWMMWKSWLQRLKGGEFEVGEMLKTDAAIIYLEKSGLFKEL
jgi:hypothetical protein